MIDSGTSTMIYPAGTILHGMATIGERLEELRTQAGLSKVAMAEAGGTSKQHYGRIVDGSIKQPAPDHIEMWARRFRVRMEWITTGRGERAVGSASQFPILTGEIIQSAYRTAIRAILLTGMSGHDFDPATDIGDADILARAIMQTMQDATSTGETEEVRAGGSHRQIGGTGSAQGEEKAWGAAADAPRKPRSDVA